MALLDRELTVPLRDGGAASIRSARPGDARALSRLVDAVAAEPPATLLMMPGDISPREWRRRIAAAAARDTSLALCAWLGGRLVGNVIMAADPHPASAHVRMLGMCVARDSRRLGLGGALLETAVAWAVAHGAAKIELSVFADNAPALAFYERHGFVREGLRRRQFVRAGEYHDEVLLARFPGPES